MKTWAEHLYRFYTSLHPTQNLPNGIEWLYPLKDKEVLNVLASFLHRYFNDTNPRRLILGINPGRFGAGITGVNFTSPKQLTEECGIEHSFKMHSELSAEFVYKFINAYGGPEQFYSRFFIGSVCPLGFVKGGKNINYYDDKELQKVAGPFIVSNMQKLLRLPVDRSACVCMGGEENYKALSKLNESYKWFEQIVPLPHPRFIMQYRRKSLEEFVQQYLNVLKNK